MPKRKILVIEDDVDIANMLRIYFEGSNYQVTLAERGEEGLESCRTDPPHVILLDIMLPDIDGYEVCRRLRGNLRTSHVPIIFLTQKDERSDRIQGLELGADDYITKPFDLDELRLRVKNTMERGLHGSLTNPTTSLPSGPLVEDQLRQLVQRNDWALLYTSIEGFGAFGDAYGFVAGEELLRYVASLLTRTVGEIGAEGSFVGHVRADKFLVVTQQDLAPRLAAELKEKFASGIGTHYDWQTRERGHLLVTDKEGKEKRADLMTMSIGIVSADDGPFTDIREITENAARALRRARLQ
ncbi:MAG: response regulator [Anaerolineales bacterium]|nr:MAG: response regulator [Anaerolineales bacterium]